MSKFEITEHKNFPGQWHAERIDIDSGDVECVIFTGAQAEINARQYAFARNQPLDAHEASQHTIRELRTELENIEFVLRKHSKSAVLIRDGDITKATINHHCSIRKGSAAHQFAESALARSAPEPALRSSTLQK